jgi:uncharacterized protein YecE (DUF72 family)
MKALKFNEFLTESFNAETPDGDAFGNFALKLLAARDQAHVFHWQTASFAQHKALGKFYDKFLENVDVLVEMMMGIKERPVFGEATISIKNYSEGAIAEFFEAAYELINAEIKLVIDPMHEEVYDQARLILADIDKLKYLLTLS